MSADINNGSAGLSRSRAVIMDALKRRGTASRTEIAASLGQTREAARQHLMALEREGWIARDDTVAENRPGRPSIRYRLTDAGDHLFPKHYDAMSIELMDTLVERLGESGLQDMLKAITDRQVERWQAELDGLDLAAKLDRLKGIYFEGDPYTRVERDGDGFVLIERNCPFLNVALQRPALCSVTVSTLSRLLGVRVYREARFQDGDRHCAFRVRPDRPLDEDFRFEFE